jgi:serine/threonine protein kinase
LSFFFFFFFFFFFDLNIVYFASFLKFSDLKSANILLSEVPGDSACSYVAKLTDFGSSIAQHGGSATMASLCKVRGTLFFLGMSSSIASVFALLILSA